MEKTYTPGPWYAVNYGGYLHIQDGSFYGDSDLFNEETCSEANDNAILAAAAPDLLESLQKAIFLLKLEGWTDRDIHMKTFQSAISKALNK